MNTLKHTPFYGLALLTVCAWGGHLWFKQQTMQQEQQLRSASRQLDVLRDRAGELQAWQEQLTDRQQHMQQLGLLEQVEKITRQTGTYSELSDIQPTTQNNQPHLNLRWERLSPTELTQLLNTMVQTTTLNIAAYSLTPARDNSGDLNVEILLNK